MIDFNDAEISSYTADFNGTVQKLSDSEHYSTVFKCFMEGNKPYILQSKETLAWRSYQKWRDSNGGVNIAQLKDSYGDAIVPIAYCNFKEFDSQKKSSGTLIDYFQKWKSHDSCLYLKDWHLMNQYPNEKVFETHKFFASDWLNEFFTMRKDVQDDYRFVYIGPKGSWTPFHADVFRSYSWSTNICGKKKWVLFPPGSEDKMKDPLGNLVYDLESTQNQMGHWSTIENGPVEVIQEAGETIFVPSGWHHQVWNLEDTISINHNWVNGSNLHKMWNYLKESLTQVEKSISDCVGMDGWVQQCQIILKATFGMDLQEYVAFLHTIMTRRLSMLKGETVESHNGWSFGEKHLIYDLGKLKWAFQRILEEIDPNIIDNLKLSVDPNHAVNLIEDELLSRENS